MLCPPLGKWAATSAGALLKQVSLRWLRKCEAIVLEASAWAVDTSTIWPVEKLRQAVQRCASHKVGFHIAGYPDTYISVTRHYPGKRPQTVCACNPWKHRDPFWIGLGSRGTGADLPIQSNDAMAFRWMSGLINHLYLRALTWKLPLGPCF